MMYSPLRAARTPSWVAGAFAVLPALGLAASACLAQSTPEWIWLSASPEDNDTIYLRKTIEIAGAVKSAKLTGACDNRMTVFLNGAQIVTHAAWEVAAQDDLTGKLKPGKNVLAVRAQNEGGPAAFLARVDIEYADGKKERHVTDTSWVATDAPADDWRKRDFDDSTWKKPHSFGKLGVGPWDSLVLDGDTSGKPAVLATAAERVNTLPGFTVDLLYSVPKPTQGSWVSMTVDPKGRLIVSDQDGALYRVTPPAADAALAEGQAPHELTRVEKLDVAIGQAQGLLCAFDALYVVVNGGAAQGSGLYRVTDANGDDQYDKVELLKKIQGGGEHGPHAVRLGPDGKLWVIAGNHTKIPDGVAADSPHRNYDEDLLLPRNPDGNGHATGVMAPGGWIARTDKDGARWELFCAGFRNQYDIAFNPEGELFSYDSDMEWDTGTPWYRPTRVNHAVSAAEFGWRFGTGKWPDYYADSLGAVVDIGLGSPTGVEFGTGAKFPAKYQRALYINDWTYGKIYAIHLVPQGASYTATFEVFVEAKPLPVTDVVVHPDGHLYFTIGGRRTQSGLYRARYTGSESTAAAPPEGDAQAAAARKTRRELEAFHGQRNPEAVAAAWPYLNSADRSIRYAARVAIEHQDVSLWRAKALAETRPTALIHAAIALARAGAKEGPAAKDDQAAIVGKLNALPWKRLTEEQALAAFRAYALTFVRQGRPDAAAAESALAALSPLYPSENPLLNRELVQLLVHLEAPDVVAKSMKLLAEASTQQDQLHYVFVLRNAKSGWTASARQAYFSWINLAEKSYKGGASFKNFLKRVRQDASATLSEAEKAELKDVLEGQKSVEVVRLETTRQFVHNWQVEDLLPMLDQVEKGRSFEKGLAAYQATQCAKCHRFQGEGGATGPDITGVGNRFDARYLLESLILPSKVVSDQYQHSLLVTSGGDVIKGRIIEDDGKTLKVRTDPFALELVSVAKADIEERRASPLSEMPQGLVNVLAKDEVLDLIAYLRSGGNKDDKAFQK